MSKVLYGVFSILYVIPLSSYVGSDKITLSMRFYCGLAPLLNLKSCTTFLMYFNACFDNLGTMYLTPNISESIVYV